MLNISETQLNSSSTNLNMLNFKLPSTLSTLTRFYSAVEEAKKKLKINPSSKVLEVNAMWSMFHLSMYIN